MTTTQDPQALATQQDIQMLSQQVQQMTIDMAQWANHIIRVADVRIQESEDRNFNVVAETLRHDIVGMHSDKIQTHQDRLQEHERRIKRLEKQNLVTPNI